MQVVCLLQQTCLYQNSTSILSFMAELLVPNSVSTQFSMVKFTSFQNQNQSVLWDALDINNFYFIFYYFSILLFFFLKNDKEACDNEVTWQVTWCDVTSLEHDGRVWKMTSGHIEYIWWPWVGHETGMRMKHGHEGRVNYW